MPPPTIPTKKQLKPDGATHLLYVVSATCVEGSWVKVGVTRELIGRVTSIACGCPIPIRSVWYRNLGRTLDESEWGEKVLHAVLNEHHSSGEWFRLRSNDDLRRLIDKVLSQFIDPSPWSEYAIQESIYRNPNSKASNLYRQADKKAASIKRKRAEKPERERIALNGITATEIATLYRSK